MKKGFTLIEMLVVIGIIAILAAASMVGYSSMVKSAENTRARELVSNVATALTAMYQREGLWPKRLLEAAESDNLLDADAALPLGKKNYLSLSVGDNKLIGYDRFGVVTPWAVNVLKQAGTSSSTSTRVKGKSTIEDHTLRFAIDTDGSGFTEVPSIDGESSVKVRATACVWCCDRDGKFGPRHTIKSWTPGQEVQ